MTEQIEDQAEDQVDLEEQSIDTEAAPDLPPGYKTYEQYVEDGGDPEMYRGPKAYQQYHGMLTDNKELQGKYNQLSNDVNTVLSSQKEMLIEQYDSKISDLKERLARQEEDLDVKGVRSTQDQINKIESKKEAHLEKDQQNNNHDPVAVAVSEFMIDNPEISPTSPNFDSRLHAEVKRIASEAERPNMTPTQAARLLQKSLDSAKKVLAGKEPKKARSTGQVQKKSVKSNKLDPNKLEGAARNIYDHFKSINNEEAAKDFLNSQLGGQ